MLDNNQLGVILAKHGFYKKSNWDDRVILYLRTSDVEAVRSDFAGITHVIVSKLSENVVTIEIMKDKETIA